MTHPRLLHSHALAELHRAIGSVIDLQTADVPTIEAVSTAMIDVLATVLARLPSAATAVGAASMAVNFGNRLTGQLAVETLNRSEMVDLAAIEREAAIAIAAEGAGHA